jgi:hypothetical protein
MSQMFRQDGQLYLLDDARVLWVARGGGGGLSDLGAFNWEALGSIIGSATQGISQIIAAKKTGIVSPVGGGGAYGGGTGASFQASGGTFSGAGSLDIKTIALWGGLGLLAIMLFKRIAK